jgi:signal transduction histidine kinase
METNSSNLDTDILIFTTVEYDEWTTIPHHLTDYSLVENPKTLKQQLKLNHTRILIVIDNAEPVSLYRLLKKYSSPHLTKILICQPSTQIAKTTPFDFVLINDNSLTRNLKQIIRFAQQQTETYWQSKQRIHDLETQLSDEKQHSNQIEILKEAIVRNVSHELKTPLLHVKSAVSLMGEDMGKENTLIRYAANATARLEALVTNITMFGSSFDLNLGPVIIRDAVEYAHRNLYRIWESKDQAKRIKLFVDEDLPPVIADRQGLSTILQLLLDNALKFSTDEIEVHAHLIKDEIEISVKDYGIGIAPKDMQTIFDSFYQIDHSSTRRYGGTGVGLALVKLLIENHRSEIVVESEPNKGSTFSFRLPIVKLK